MCVCVFHFIATPVTHAHRTEPQWRCVSWVSKKRKELFIQLQKCSSADSLGISLNFQGDITLFLGSLLQWPSKVGDWPLLSTRSIPHSPLKLPVGLTNTSSALFWRLRLSLPILLPQAYLWCDGKWLTVGSDLWCLPDFFGVNTSTSTSFSLSVGHCWTKSWEVMLATAYPWELP